MKEIKWKSYEDMLKDKNKAEEKKKEKQKKKAKKRNSSYTKV